jgi:hypothetical protein
MVPKVGNGWKQRRLLTSLNAFKMSELNVNESLSTRRKLPGSKIEIFVVCVTLKSAGVEYKTECWCVGRESCRRRENFTLARDNWLKLLSYQSSDVIFVWLCWTLHVCFLSQFQLHLSSRRISGFVLCKWKNVQCLIRGLKHSWR